MEKSRILKEASEAKKLKDSSFYLFMDKEKIHNWTGYLYGPEDSPFNGGIFKIRIHLGLFNSNLYYRG